MTLANLFWVSALNSTVAPQTANGARVWTPTDLLNNRGIQQKDFNPGDIFVDDLLGYVIRREADGAAPATVVPFGVSDGGLSSSLESRTPRQRNTRYTIQRPDNLPAPFGPAPPLTADDTLELINKLTFMPTQSPWHATRLGGWPAFTGAGQRVAVLDSGVANVAPLHRNPLHVDYCSCAGPGAVTGDISGHGTSCVGVINAHWTSGRYSVAPDCDVLAAQVIRFAGSEYTTLVDMLLMLSWAVHSGARIISMSFCASASKLAVAGPPDILGVIARRLRSGDRALIFCAATEQDSGITYPASLDGVVAINGYAQANPAITAGPIHVARIAPGMEENWLPKNSTGDLLFAPSSLLDTVLPDGSVFPFGNVSGACAYTAGIAALYLQRNDDRALGLTLNQILAQMKSDSDKLPSPDPLHPWHCLRFPV